MQAGTAEYADAFANHALILPPPITAELAGQAFDKLWAAFDKDYAMFVLRPEVDCRSCVISTGPWHCERNRPRSSPPLVPKC